MDIKDKHKTECINNNKGSCLPKTVVNQLKPIFSINDNVPVDKTLKKIKKETNCNSESCIFTDDNVKSKVDSDAILEAYYKPEGPRDTNDWFSNINIDTVLSNWSKEFPFFYHVPFQMIDFYKTNSTLAQLYIPDIASQYQSLGVVINTDYSSGPGIHWFCVYMDFTNKTLEYFNSSGNMPMVEIQAYLHKVRNDFKVIGEEYTIVIASRIMHQLSESECGPYSMYYIWSRLHKVSHSVFDEKRIPDEKMYEFRQTLFRQS